MAVPAIVADSISKRFRLPSIPKYATIKDLVIRSVERTERGCFVEALDDVSFTVERGTTLGIIGRNGSGKSTLLRVLAGILPIDRGELSLHGSVAPLLALGTGFHPDLTGREGARIELLALGLTRAQTQSVMDEAISFSEIGPFIDQPVRTYSSGMLMRLAFAVAISVDPDILLLDEVLAVGDEAFSRTCLQRLDAFKRAGKTIVLVTHADDIVRAWCDRALWIDEGRVRSFGEPAKVIDAYRRALGLSTSPEPLAQEVLESQHPPFTCNACGVTARLLADDEFTRESGRCVACGSFVRLRSVIHLASEHLFEHASPVPEWPQRRDLRIVGIRDPVFFQSFFASKVTYTNVDFGSAAAELQSCADVVICCDVLDHIAPPVQPAFDELLRILRPGGLLVLTVPYTFDQTVEHFSDLNRTRVFGLADLKARLRQAGFTDVRIFDDDHLEYGIGFDVRWSLPITARRPL